MSVRSQTVARHGSGELEAVSLYTSPGGRRAGLGACTELREFLENYGQGYVLRVPSSFHLTLGHGITATCAQAVTRLLKDARRREVRSARAGSLVS